MTAMERNVTEMIDFVTVEEAAVIMGLGQSQTRALLGEPDSVQLSAAGQVQYVYKRSRVEEVANFRQEKRRKRAEVLGKRSCYFCREKFDEDKLSGGFCPSCHARKLVRNFLCYGDACRNGMNKERLKYLADAIAYYQAKDTEI